MNTLAWFLIAPLFLISGCLYLCLLIAVACAVARFARPSRLKVTMLRRGRIPADGTPLTPGEAYQFAGIRRGWKQRAPEPQYQDESEW